MLSGQLRSINYKNVSCLSYQLGKQPTLLFNKSDYNFFTPFDLIYSYVWGPLPHNTMGGLKYFVILDDYTRFT